MTLVKVELIGGPADGSIVEVRDDTATTITVATPSDLDASNAPNDGDLTPPYISTVYWFNGSITDDGTRRFATSRGRNS